MNKIHKIYVKYMNNSKIKEIITFPKNYKTDFPLTIK